MGWTGYKFISILGFFFWSPLFPGSPNIIFKKGVQVNKKERTSPKTNLNLFFFEQQKLI